MSLTAFTIHAADVVMAQGQDALFTAHIKVPKGESLSQDAHFSFELPLSSNEENASYTSIHCYMYQDGKDPKVLHTDKFKLTNFRKKDIAILALSTPLIEYDKDFTIGCQAKAAGLQDTEDDIKRDNYSFTISDSSQFTFGARFRGQLRKTNSSKVVIDRRKELSIYTEYSPAQTTEVRVYGAENLQISDFSATDCVMSVDGKRYSSVFVKKNLEKGYLYYPYPTTQAPKGKQVKIVCKLASSPISFAPTVWGYPSVAHVEEVDANGTVVGFHSVSPSLEKNDQDETSAAVSLSMAALVSTAAAVVISLLF